MRTSFKLLSLALIALASGANASDTLLSERGKHIKAYQAATTVGDTLFGDRVNLYTGALEFVQEDASLPGNPMLPLAVRRRLVIGGLGVQGQGLFANWDLELPHIHGMFSDLHGWRDGQGGNARCTQFGAPPTVPGRGGDAERFRADEYWYGTALYIPGIGDQELVRSSPSGLTTGRLWEVRCLDRLANEDGEGFLVISPDGVQYRFDWLVSRPVSRLYKAAPTLDAKSHGMQRREVLLLPTLVSDRDGNTLRYTYDTSERWKLQSVERGAERLSLSYSAGTSLIESITDGKRTWRYAYGSGPYSTTILHEVAAPDQARWQLSGLDGADGAPGIVSLALDYLPEAEPSLECDAQPAGLNSPVVRGSMIHPSGVQGIFELTPTQHGRNGVPGFCYSDGKRNSAGIPLKPQYYDTYALTAKTVIAPQEPARQWSLQYETFNPGIPVCITCSNVVTVADPSGKRQRYSFGSTFGVNEGMLQKQELIGTP